MHTATNVFGLASLALLTFGAACSSDGTSGAPGNAGTSNSAGASGASNSAGMSNSAGTSGASNSAGTSNTAGTSNGGAAGSSSVAGSGGSSSNHLGGSGGSSSAGAGNTAGSSAAGSSSAGATGSGGSAGGSSGGSGGTAGGTSTAGSSGQAGSGGSSAVTEQNPYTLAGGYYSAGELKGYAYTFKDSKGSTITPDNFGAIAAMAALCASGSVVADPGYGGYAVVAVNANQTAAGEASFTALAPSGTGLKLTVDNIGGSPLRLVINGGDGIAYCMNVTGPGGVYAWSDFNTTCWTTGGTSFATSAGISAVQVVVPGGNTDPVPFDYCINELSETH